MIKFILIYFCCLCFIHNQIFADDNNLQLFDYELRGNVLKFTEKIFVARADKATGNINKKILITEIEYLVVRTNDVLKKNVKENSTITYYNYNKNYQIESISVERVEKDKSIISAGKTIYVYDEYLRPTLELNYGPSGRLKDSIVISVDKTSFNIEKRAFNSKGEFQYQASIRYNEAKKIDKKINIRIESSTKYLYTFDENGRLVDERWYLNDNIVQLLKFEYNDKGKMTKRIEYDKEDNPVATLSYEYDPLTGFLLCEINQDHVSKYEYNYDKNGNWVVRYEYYDGILTKIIEREIAY